MTPEKFNTYCDIRESGMTNMFDVNMVVSLSGGTLTREDCLDIMKNFGDYKIKFI